MKKCLTLLVIREVKFKAQSDIAVYPLQMLTSESMTTWSVGRKCQKCMLWKIF